MTRHRPRLRRLWRLPSVRVIGTAATATALVAAAGARWPWVSVAALAAGAVGIGEYVRRNRTRIEVEVRMVRALRDSAPRRRAAEVSAGGVSRIVAPSYPDAVRELGEAMGRDRAFQLDLMRRTASGRLAQVWGRTALPSDVRYRELGLAAAAAAAAELLAEPERELLTAFADGVNAAFTADGPPFESRFLSYRPAPWTVTDSVLVALFLFHSLSWNEQGKRAEAIVRRALPNAVADFFLPGNQNTVGGADNQNTELPADLARFRATGEVADVIALDRAIAGSNCWVRGGPDGPVLACDLHLPLTMPNVLYEVDLEWPGTRLRGLAVPGLPIVLTGTNGRIAWGVTNLTADVLDIVPADGLGSRTERIRVRGREDKTVDVVTDGTMPVSSTPLLGEKVALRWTGHDPRACDLRFQRLAMAQNVGEAVALLDDAQGVALNVLVTDLDGRMAHLATGLLPRRPADTPRGSRADGHLTGAERPRLIDPPDGILVSANDEALPEDPFRIGFDLDPGYRARRIRDVLATTGNPDPAAMRALQHDTAAELYLPYRDLAVAASTGRPEIAALLADWDGRADVDSRAFPVLVRLRDILAQRVLSPYLARCREHDPAFEYPFRSLDRPLLAILRADDPALLPADAADGGVTGFVAACVDRALSDLGDPDLPTWGSLNTVGLTHPLAGLAPWAHALLGIRPRPEAGMLHSVRTRVDGFGAAGRAVLTPAGHAGFELPGGQSGHPLSPHFADRHEEWSSGQP